VDVPVLEINDLSLSLGGKEILRDVSFQVHGGRHLCILGPNGAGKTSLIKCLMGIWKNWNGGIRVHGRSLSEMSQRQLARTVGYVPQADSRLFPFTVGQFILMARYPHLSPFSPTGPEDHRAVEEALQITGTSAFRERDIRTLSGGERQKVFIAGALAQGASILLLDEPTTFLDPLHEEQVLEILDRLRRHTQATILTVTHNINHAALLADHVVALEAGEVVFDGSPAGFMDNSVLEKVYGRTFTFVRHPVDGTPVVVPERIGK
jgi:iron complex transport system ATP-binding protein